MNAIEIKELHKSFGDKEAVKGLNLDIGHHELFGLLGVNGAGKTTTIRMICCLFKPTSDQAASNVERIIKDFILEEIADDKAKTLSGGWQRRLSIAMALVTEPEILFLDEPTLGLDVIARRELWETIRKLKSTMTIVLTTHYLEEAEALCDRIAVMSRGKLMALGTAEELKAKAGCDSFEDAFVKLAEGKECGRDV